MALRAPRHAAGRCRATLVAAFILGVGCSTGLAQLPAQPATVPLQPASRTCAGECHKTIVDHTALHGPVQQDCALCHIQTGDPEAHEFAFIVPREGLCVKCHALPHEAGMHAPVREGKCTECHDPHGSDRPGMLVADARRELCLRCHKQDFSSSKFVHGPVAVGACIVCHKPHSSGEPMLLVQEPRALCLTCHGEILTKEEGTHLHGALEKGCTGCHSPHASDHRFQLLDAAPGLCLSCHQDTFNRMAADAKVIHGAIHAEGGCTVCHEAHASRQDKLRRGSEPETCLACHDRELKTPEGAPIANMAKLLADNPDHHGPIREGACTACHNPHAGNNFRMLAEEYPPLFYAPFKIDTFKLCFKCHIPDMVLKPSASGLTRFRDGDRNLHWLHVNQEKGRTCRACHEVHASTRPSHIRDSVPFGSTGWMLEINYEKLAEGGRCSPGCHATRNYSRTAATTAQPGANQ